MAQFMIEMPHTSEQCMQALDELSAKSPDLLSKTNWGCMAGNHTGWALVDAGSEFEARSMVPPAMRDMVNITEINKFTPDQIRSMHEIAA